MSNNIKPHLCGLSAIVFFGSSFPFSRLALQYFTPNALGFLRCFLASIILLVIGRLLKFRLPFKTSHYFLFFLSGTLGFGFYLFLFNIGMKTVSSGTGSIIIAAAPILTAAAASILYNERINKVGLISILAAFCGVLIIILWEGIFSVNTGLLWLSGGAFSFTAYNLLNRQFSNMGYTSIETVSYSMAGGAVFLLPFSAQGFKELLEADLQYVVALSYLGIFTSALGYFLFSKGIQCAKKTTDVTNYLFVNPLVASITGYIMLGETLNAGSFIGGSIIIASIVVFTLKGKAENTNVCKAVKAD